MPLDGVPQRQLGVELVFIASSDALTAQITVSHQVGDYALRGALGDADPFRYIAEPDLGILRNAQQNVGVIGEKGPSGHT
jgi:hypothetical protein